MKERIAGAVCRIAEAGGGSQTPTTGKLEATEGCKYNCTFLPVRSRKFKDLYDSCDSQSAGGSCSPLERLLSRQGGPAGNGPTRCFLRNRVL